MTSIDLHVQWTQPNTLHNKRQRYPARYTTLPCVWSISNCCVRKDDFLPKQAFADQREFGVLLLLLALAPLPTGPVHVDALYDDTLFVESENHELRRRWKNHCLTPFFLVYAFATRFAIFMLLSLALLKWFCNCMMFAKRFCRKEHFFALALSLAQLFILKGAV